MKNLIFILLLGLFVPLAQAYDFKCCSVIPIMKDGQIILNDESCVNYREATGSCNGDKQYKVTEMIGCPKNVKKIGDTTYEIYRCSTAKK